ncbi:hypothetical protein F2Q70_00006802 [Brassica cretica]|uniref:Uncharacterized protein n=1 Tax=Brassica cretica TaxID=69181 RepID=A0A8S9J365_BRACR|nr:hypothetical protein F2Q68_00023471 [Brassica cretica]KAF2576514.1 hypothetical protein F2Q70_00006802 [Brassica cretica]
MKMIRYPSFLFLFLYLLGFLGQSPVDAAVKKYQFDVRFQLPGSCLKAFFFDYCFQIS